MAKKNNSTDSNNEEKKKGRFLSFFKNETFKFVSGLLLIFFVLYLCIAYFSFFNSGYADQSTLDAMNHGVEGQLASNSAGVKGAQISQLLINDSFGVSSIFMIVFFAMAGLKLISAQKFKLVKWCVYLFFLTLWGSIFFSATFDQWLGDSFIRWGGKHGMIVYNWFYRQIGNVGVALLLIVSMLCFLIIASPNVFVWVKKVFTVSFWMDKMKSKNKQEVLDNPNEEVLEQEDNKTELAAVVDEAVVAKVLAEDVDEFKEQELSADDELPVLDSLEEKINEELLGNEEVEDDENEINCDEKAYIEVPGAVDELPDVPMTIETPEEEPVTVGADGAEPTFTVEVPQEEMVDPSKLEPYNPKLDLENYKYPTLDLLKHYDNSEPIVDETEQQANKERIIRTLSSFGIEITNIKATVGPTVTLYEITPKEGVRISKIRGLEDDIALSLAALGIRIIAPIPGKGTIGIEVPNSNPRVVSGQSILGSKKFQETKFDLPIAMGKTITNEVFMVDLCKMPHVLVAGATGQGKSVGLNAMITSLLYKKHPSELKFVMVDPKKVEFSIYSVIEKHFLAKLPDGEEAIICDVKKVVQTLNSLCIEMDSRYDLLKAAKVRNIKEYNEKFINRSLNPENGHRFMPYIVVVIDEFGDLIMTAGKEVELPIARIAQLARAVGIHMIIATQRPTTNIITGTIKANFPARFAFRVSASVDSRTILDRPGANQLIGRGDMLILQGADPIRVQCAFIDTPEIRDITNYIAKQQGYPTAFYLPEYVDENAGGDMEDMDTGKLDALFEDAARLIVIHQQGSTSLIQRKFSIGYNRAGRIMDQMEKAGIVGPAQGGKPREVLCISEDDLQMRLQNLLN